MNDDECTEKVTVTLKLHPETIELLQRTPLLKSRDGRSFDQTLESYLDMVASTVEFQLTQRTAKERRAEMHLVTDE